ncbi:MAG: redoxin domain-containing protein [Bacteroidales bacterium]|nr:redoxin domain-containing protein [Bacteroidales bacterium]
MKQLIFMALSFFSLFSCSAGYKNLDVEQFADAVKDGACILDVRTPEEFAEGSIPGAVNVDWNGEDFLAEVDALFDASEPLYLYCRSGRRSADASKALTKAGYKKVFNLLGGYNAWTEAGKNIDQDPQYAVNLLPAGSEAPEIILKDIEGKEVKLSDFRGKQVVLVFWASWCPDCRAEVPELKEMYAKADPAKVQFVSVSFDREFEALVKYAAENELPGVQLFDPAGKKESKVGADYGVKWIPSLYLIDAEGKVQLGTVMAWKIAAALNGEAIPSPRQSKARHLCDDPDHCEL